MKKRIYVSTASFVVASAALELVFRHGAHPIYFWHSLPAFDFVYGFVGCGVIVLGSKWLGHRFLQRDEDFYDR